MVAKNFQIYSVNITANIFVSQKIESVHFYLCLQAKLSRVFIIIFQADGNCPFLPNSFFEDILKKEGGRERIMELKKIPKLTKVSVTSFDKFHHLCNLYIFGLCFVLQ